MKTLAKLLKAIEKYDLKHVSFNLVRDIIHANGCGAKDSFKVPNTIWGVDIEPACQLHDIGWELAQSYQDLIDVNEQFDNNLKKITDYESANDFTRGIRRLRIAKFILAVELIGTENYAIERGFEK